MDERRSEVTGGNTRGARGARGSAEELRLFAYKVLMVIGALALVYIVAQGATALLLVFAGLLGRSC